MKIRLATPTDASALLAVYAQYIDTCITFEYALPSPDVFRLRIAEVLKTHPFYLAEDSSGAVGYAYAHPFQTRDAYQWGAELAIYLDRTVCARGLGTHLYSHLIGQLRRQGVRTVYGCVTTPNPASERLHLRLGFLPVGVFRNAGYKNGAWHDVTWFEKSIAPYDTPQPLVPCPNSPAEFELPVTQSEFL